MTTYWVAISRQERGFSITTHHTGSEESKISNWGYSSLEQSSLPSLEETNIKVEFIKS